MGWSTECLGNIYFHKETYNSKLEVQDVIDDTKNLIEDAKQSLLIYISSNPKDLIDVDCEGNECTLSDSIKHKLNEALIQYEDALIDKIKYEYLLENWHTRQGDFVKQDEYYEYLGDKMLGLIPNRIYGVNKEIVYNNKIKYWVLNKEFNFIPIKEEEFNSLFRKSTYEDYNKQEFN